MCLAGSDCVVPLAGMLRLQLGDTRPGHEEGSWKW